MKRWTIVGAMLAFTGCSASTDFAMICTEARATPQDRTAFAQRVEARLRNGGVRKVWSAAGMVADNEKVAILKQGASELGTTFDCPDDIARLYGPQK